VLTLAGFLKDILLVAFSVIIWSTPITALQLFGYSIALGGLIYYKIGGEQAHTAYMKLRSVTIPYPIGSEDGSFQGHKKPQQELDQSQSEV
jgi:hypothetical protein